MPTALQGFRENNRERRGVGPPCQHSRAFSASGKGLKRWPLILSPTLRRRTDLGFTRDRHIKYASRLQPTCGAPSRRMAAGFRLACARPSRRAQERAPQDEADWCVEMIRSSIAVPERVWRESNRAPSPHQMLLDLANGMVGEILVELGDDPALHVRMERSAQIRQRARRR